MLDTDPSDDLSRNASAQDDAAENLTTILARPQSGSARALSLRVKRIIDIAGSLTLLIFLTPVLAIAIIAIALSSGRPVFYCAKRWGLGERKFTCLKLRTMHVNPNSLMAKKGLSEVAEDGRTLTYVDDPRIDRVGSFLRRFSLDEIPQLINILRGDMSLIGPRPLVESMLKDFPEIRAARSVMRPGLTGLWQVRKREKNVGVLDMIADDMEYIQNFSLYLDFKIAVMTPRKIVGP